MLDTWFSSWLWPFSTLGWPDETEDLKRYYPGSLLVSAWDILFFWVARMIMAGLEFLNEIPFTDVLIHGVLRDEKRRKLSKSLGNSPDPMELFDRYGVDGTRFSLISIAPEGRDIIFSEKKMEIGRNFCNKMWNAARLLLMYVKEGEKFERNIDKNPYLEDKWIIMKFNKTLKKVEENLEKFDYPEVAKSIYHFFWSHYCDFYLESIKDRLKNEKERKNALNISLLIMENFLKLSHPLVPFITEEIWHKLPFEKKEESISISEWPEEFNFNFENEEKEMDFLIDIISLVREIKGIYKIPLKEEINVYIKEEKSERFKKILKNLSYGNIVLKKPDRNFLGYMIDGEEIIIEFPEKIDVEREKERIKDEISELERIIENIDKKLRNPDFLMKAPQKVITETENKKKKFEEKLKALKRYV